jgi:hypothetical protein
VSRSVPSQQFAPTNKPKNDSVPSHNAEQSGQVVGGKVDVGVQGHSHRKRKEKYRNENLPGYPDTLKNFRDLVLPHWYYYISSLDKP